MDEAALQNAPLENAPPENAPLENAPPENAPLENAPLENAPSEIVPSEDCLNGNGESCSAEDDLSDFFQHSWRSSDVDDSFPAARNGHSADVIGPNQVYTFGGWNGETELDDLYVLNVETNEVAWRQLSISDAPSARSNHATAVVRLNLFVHGGMGEGKYLDDLHVLDTQALTWTQWTPSGSCPSACADHTLSKVGDKLYLFGCRDEETWVNTMDVLDIAAKFWIQPEITGTPPEARFSHSMTVMESSLILFGGSNGANNLGDLHLFNTETLTWTELEMLGSPPPGLSDHTATLIGDRLFVFGGLNENRGSNRIYMLETASFQWSNLQDVKDAPSGRDNHASFSVGSTKLFVFGGWDGKRQLNDLFFLDIGRLTTDMLTYGPTKSQVCNMRRLVGDPRFADVILVVEGHEIPAHRCILDAQSDYFHAMFSGPMRESKQERIPTLGCKYEPFITMLKFLYTGCLCETRTSTICDVLALADQYCLDQLMTLCENRLIHSVDSENVCHILEYADKYQAPNLKYFCRNYIQKHAEEVSKTKGFENLSRLPVLLDIIRLLSKKERYHLGVAPDPPEEH